MTTMAKFDESKVERFIKEVQTSLDKGTKNPYDYMERYKELIGKEEYEAAKAITEVLAKIGWDTKQTHPYIKSLK